MKAVKKCWKDIMTKPTYVVLSVVVFLVFFLSAIFLANYSFLGYVIGSEKHSLLEKAMLFWTSIEYFKSGFTLSSQISTIIISILAGINVSIVTYYVRSKIKLGRASGLGIFGIVSGIFGIGCSACGSILITSVFGLSTTTFITTKLPLHGAEFGIIGILLLLVSIYIICEKIANPSSCAIPNK